MKPEVGLRMLLAWVSKTSKGIDASIFAPMPLDSPAIDQ
jgi:hypothetical protein